MAAPPNGVLFNEARAKPLSTTGAIQPGAYYQFYLTGTLTLTNVYADGGLFTPLSQTPGTGGTTAASDGRLVPIYLNPATTYRYQLYSAVGVLLEDIDPYIPVSSPTQAQIGLALYPQTALELSASVTPINFNYPPLTVDRYGTNTTPGTTSMAVAFQAAINVMRKGGGVLRYGATAPYLIDAPLDCTFTTGANQFGLSFREDGNTAIDSPSLIFKHTGYCFDLTGCDAFTFYDCTIGTDNTTFPKVCFFQARVVVAGSNSQLPRILHTKVQGKFSVAIQYNYASEDGVYIGNYWTNSYVGAAGRVVYITANNILGLTSTFANVRSGPQSCIDHEYIGGQYVMLSSDAAADVFYFDHCSHVKMFGPWVGCTTGAGVGGRSIIFVDMTNGDSSHIHLSAVQSENAVPQNTYGILFSNIAGIPSQWRIDDCYFPAATNAISAPALVTLDSFYVTQLKQGSANNGISCTNIQNSILEMGPILLTVTGTSTANYIVGFATNITLAARVKTVVVDMNSGNIQTNGVIGIVNQPPPASIGGFGTPTGAVVVPNYPGATATLLQTSNTVAEILTILKNVGFITS